MAIFVSAEDLNTKFQPHPKFYGVSIARLAGEADGLNLGVSLLEISVGIEIPIHTHPESVDSIYCLSGQGQIFHSGQWHPFEKGDYCLVPPGQEHGVRNGDTEKMRLFIVHSPPLF